MRSNSIMKQKCLLFLLGLCLSPNSSLSETAKDNTVNEDAGEKFALYAIVEGEPDQNPASNQIQGRSFLGNYGGWNSNSYLDWNPLQAKEQLLHSKLQFIFSLFPRLPFGSNPVPPMYGPPPPGAFPGQPPYLTPAVHPGSAVPYPGGPLPPRPGSTCYLPPHCYNPVPVPGLPPCIPVCPSVEETTTESPLASMASVAGKPTSKPIFATSDSQMMESGPNEEDKKEGSAGQDEPVPEEPGETDEGESRKKLGRPNPRGKAKRF